MLRPRRSTEEGPRRKFLVIIDDTPECSRAVLYGALRAQHTAGALVMLYVIVPGEFQHWIGVENIMRAEAMETAEETLGHFAEMAREISAVEPQMVIREGTRAEEIARLIEEQDTLELVTVERVGEVVHLHHRVKR